MPPSTFVADDYRTAYFETDAWFSRTTTRTEPLGEVVTALPRRTSR
ncbi:hypothetical protein [Nocardia sp. NPDC047038]